MVKEYTLIFPINYTRNLILLGMKKRGFGSDKWNGFGGKIEPTDEGVIEAARRELKEECGVQAHDLIYVAENHFTLADGFQLLVHTFVCREFEGSPEETDEMRPKFFSLDKIPYDTMWDDDKYWLPLMLEKHVVKCKFTFDKDNKVLPGFTIEKVGKWR